MEINESKPTKKWCRSCRQAKPVEAFNTKGKGKNRDELRPVCISCEENPIENKSYQGRENRRKSRILNPEIQIHASARFRAQKKNIPFNIEVSDIVIPELCPVLGISIFRNEGKKCSGPHSPSLDRIIPELGYVKGNITIISQRANLMKSDATFEQCVMLGEYAARQIVARDFLAKTQLENK